MSMAYIFQVYISDWALIIDFYLKKLVVVLINYVECLSIYFTDMTLLSGLDKCLEWMHEVF